MFDDMNMHEALVATEDGHFVTQKWAHLAQMIEDFDSKLELRWIPPNLREIGDGMPYVVVAKQKDGQEYAVLYAQDSDDPVDVMAKLFDASMKHGDVLTRMRNRNAAVKLFEMKKQLEEELERQEQVAWLASNPKNYKTWRNPRTGELVKLDSNLNRINTRKHIT